MFKVNQKVWDVVAGEGVVSRIDKEYHYPVVVKFSDGNERTYSTDGKSVKSNEPPSLYPYPVEIVKKVVKPSINWEHVRGEYKFLAQDANGNAWLYWEKPEPGEDHWFATQGTWCEADSHVSYVSGICDWKDSLIERPAVQS